ncbi:hypothetical protein [Sphingobacterium sp.]|uniref:hypothetical protein n=1 Tax=Sphingobacterium sp. TaxID=341027 RepID=UPI002FDC8AC2
MMISLFIVVLLTAVYLINRTIVRRRNELKDVSMAINYRFQDHPGQYSGSLSANHGMLVFRATRNGQKASNIMIRDVKIKDRRITAKLQQTIIMPFRGDEEVSVASSLRFRVNSAESGAINLQDRKIELSGIINYNDGSKKPFRTIRSIGEVYQCDLAFS